MQGLMMQIYFILFRCSEKFLFMLKDIKSYWFISNPLKMLPKFWSSGNAAANMISPVFLIVSPIKWILSAILPKLSALNCSTRSDMTVFIYGSCSLDLFPVPSLGKLLMTLAVLEWKNKLCFFIQTYITWQALLNGISACKLLSPKQWSVKASVQFAFMLVGKKPSGFLLAEW